MALKNKIESAKKDIKETYYVIGEKFYSENQGSIPAGYEEAFGRINAANQAIAEAEEEIRPQTEGATCPKCGAKVKKGFAFCTNCGCRMEEEKKPDNGMIECPNCHNSVPGTSAFCNFCGTKLEKPAEPEVEAAPIEKTCPNCGHKTDPDAAFCNMCGTPL